MNAEDMKTVDHAKWLLDLWSNLPHAEDHGTAVTDNLQALLEIHEQTEATRRALMSAVIEGKRRLMSKVACEFNDAAVKAAMDITPNHYGFTAGRGGES